eukprot:symbB.v1.2.033935.t1/scaffold4289.1/size41860/2
MQDRQIVVNLVSDNRTFFACISRLQDLFSLSSPRTPTSKCKGTNVVVINFIKVGPSSKSQRGAESSA